MLFNISPYFNIINAAVVTLKTQNTTAAAANKRDIMCLLLDYFVAHSTCLLYVLCLKNYSVILSVFQKTLFCI